MNLKMEKNWRRGSQKNRNRNNKKKIYRFYKKIMDTGNYIRRYGKFILYIYKGSFRDR